MLGLLPWEKWLPPYVYGPLLCLGSIAVLMFSDSLTWWHWALLLSGSCLGAAVTWTWIKTGRNLFETGDEYAVRMKRKHHHD